MGIFNAIQKIEQFSRYAIGERISFLFRNNDLFSSNRSVENTDIDFNYANDKSNKKFKVKIGSVPFQEAIAFHREKLNIPTQRWDDLLGEIHSKAFTVAGATKLDLLKDLHEAVNKSISQGLTITDFRKDFDQIVKEHGWSYKGKRGRRTRTIYDTNLRSAHMAGRWEQIQRTKETRPYLQYVTTGDRRVRPEHQSWDGVVLPIDDPWWKTHHPLNGWGCRCSTRTLNERQIKREKLKVSKSPEIEYTRRINKKTGEDYGLVPKGIDVGWDYNVGEGWIAPEVSFGERLAQLPKSMRSAAFKALNDQFPVLERSFKMRYTVILNVEVRPVSIIPVGYLSPPVLTNLSQPDNIIKTAAIAVTGTTLIEASQAIPSVSILKIPSLINKPKAILINTQTGELIYIGEEDSGGNVVVVRIKQTTKKGEAHMAQDIQIDPISKYKNARNYKVVEGQL